MVGRILNSGVFIDKMKKIGKIPEGSLLVTADLVGLYHIMKAFWIKTKIIMHELMPFSGSTLGTKYNMDF